MEKQRRENREFIEKKMLGKFNQLVADVHDYESDTFSAKESKISWNEAREVALALASDALQDLINHDSMDGVAITNALTAVRGECEQCGVTLMKNGECPEGCFE